MRQIALPILIVGRTDLPELRPNLDIGAGYKSAGQAWSAARPESAALRAGDRLQASALRDDIAQMMSAEDGEPSRAMYTQWLATIEDAPVIAMFAPLGEAAKKQDFDSIMRITGQWRRAASEAEPPR